MLLFMKRLQINEIISYRDMCNIENQEQLQRGMNFNMNPLYSVVLMSIKTNSPYEDKISEDGLTIYYEGHDATGDTYKKIDQPSQNPNGSLTQNGKFVKAIEIAKDSDIYPLVRVYEKLRPGIWNYRGLFELKDYKFIQRGSRKVFEFTLTITDQDFESAQKQKSVHNINVEQTRQIPGNIKSFVFKRDNGQCVKCGARDNIHFDHILPYSLGGTSLKAENIQILCARHNLQKSDSLEK